MKLIKRVLERGGEGSITLQPQEDEDMWHVYNIVAVGDAITASAIRKVQKESSTGSSSQSRVRFNLTLEVLHVDFDVQASKIRIRGKNVTESEYIKMGQHHTIELELGKNFSIFKTCWDSIYLERVDMACDPRNLADLAAIVMQQGLAHVCLITPNMTLIRAKIEVSVPRKRAGSTGHDKAMSRFFDAIIEAVTRHINFSIVKCVVIASPGYVAEDYSSYMFEQAIKKDIKQISENKSKFMICHSSSGFKHALREVLADPAVAVKVAETKAYSEVKALADFFETLNEDEHRAFYGFNLIKRANEEKAVQTLLVTDDLFRNANLQTRRQYVELVERVRENGGEVHVFSSLHVSGEQLSKLGGVAAILRFPLVIEDDEPEPDSDDEKKAPALPPLSAAAAKGASGVEEELSDGDIEDEPKAAGAGSAVEAVEEEDADGGAGDLDGTDD